MLVQLLIWVNQNSAGAKKPVKPDFLNTAFKGCLQ